MAFCYLSNCPNDLDPLTRLDSFLLLSSPLLSSTLESASLRNRGPPMGKSGRNKAAAAAAPSPESVFTFACSRPPSHAPLVPPLGVSLRMWDFAQCDPKRCTGQRLAKRGLMSSMPLKQPFKGVVLSPNGTKAVSPADGDIISKKGLSVIDCR